MGTGKLTKYILLLVLTINCHKAQSQNKFISYQDFVFAYKKNPDLQSLSKRFDLLSVLLLDSSNKQRFFKYDPRLEEEFKEYSYGMKLDKSTVGFVTQHTDIKKTFSSTSRITNCLFDESINPKEKHLIKYPIHIKDNNAIVEIMTNSGIDIYYFRLHKGIVQINWLGGTIE